MGLKQSHQIDQSTGKLQAVGAVIKAVSSGVLRTENVLQMITGFQKMGLLVEGLLIPKATIFIVHAEKKSAS